MTPELQNKLIQRFPMIFADRYADMSRTCMVWGFECGDGWYELIYMACLGIEEEYNRIYPWYTKMYHRLAYLIVPRWNKLISHQPDWMLKTRIWGPEGNRRTWKEKRFYLHMPYWSKASQIKEKYGSLRFYLTTSTDKMDTYTGFAEHLSHEICEQCGKWGKLRGGGWLYTACDEHAKEGDKDEQGSEGNS